MASFVEDKIVETSCMQSGHASHALHDQQILVR